ncbi:hypothetical protein LXL04_013972 [Taraxacum kok-saghyz]
MGKRTPHRLPWWMSSMVVLMFIKMISKQVVSQSSDHRNYTLIRNFCRPYNVWNGDDYLSNLNSSLSSLRIQLSDPQVYTAFAHAASNSEYVYSFALCMEYLSTSECLACFDTAVIQTKSCGMADGGHVVYDNCSIRIDAFVAKRYEKSDELLLNDDASPFGVCGNEAATEPTQSFVQNIEELLSDILVATPKTSTFYVASTRQVSTDNTTVYAIAQCVTQISHNICQTCLNRAYKSLHDCLPNTEGTVTDALCFVRYSETPFFHNNQTTNILPFLSKGSSRKTGMIAGISSGVGILLVMLAFWLWYRQRKKSKNGGGNKIMIRFYKLTTSTLNNVILIEEAGLQGSQGYRYQDLRSGTHNFDDEHIIGKGGFGEVFKAVIDDKNIVAVKRLHVGYGFAKSEFDNEVKLISNIQHRNLVRQLGWCIKGPELLLVLEYMEQGSLDKFLWGEKKGNLNWEKRFDIIFGIAKGIAHLHNECHVKIIHRDIKSNNILLDDDFQPKIADFGLARFHGEDQSHISTQVAGTLGYMAPEYAKRGHLSEKVDTYSFGIVALEVISGRRCTDENFNGPDTSHLLAHAWKLYETLMHIELIDETLGEEDYNKVNVLKTIEIALMCTQSPPSLRPTMSEVVLMLSKGQSLDPGQLIKPTFIDYRKVIHIVANR